MDVLGVLPNGYHEVETVMQSIGLMDETEVLWEEIPGMGQVEIMITCSKPFVPLDEKNLAAKAVQQTGGGGGGGARKKAQPGEDQVKNSLAQAVAAARGKIAADPNGAAFYANGDRTLVDRVKMSDLPKYVKTRARMNGAMTR